MNNDQDLEKAVAQLLRNLVFNEDAVQFGKLAKEIMVIVRERDRELLHIAYGQLQQSSTAYDSGCNIIRQILGE
jgi:hypothetical protein